MSFQEYVLIEKSWRKLQRKYKWEELKDELIKDLFGGLVLFLLTLAYVVTMFCF